MTNRGEQSPAQWQGSPLERKPKSAAVLGRGRVIWRAAHPAVTVEGAEPRR